MNEFIDGFAKFDHPIQTPREVITVPCGACNETGYLCESELCWGPPLPNTGVRVRNDVCIRNHICCMCSGDGRITSNRYDAEDDKAERDFDDDRERERGVF